MYDPKIALKVSELQKHLAQANDLLEELHQDGLSVVVDLEATPDNKSFVIRLQSAIEHNVYF
jgi:hypothetical protein